MSLDYRTKKYNLTNFHQIHGDSAKLCLKVLCRAWVGHGKMQQFSTQCQIYQRPIVGLIREELPKKCEKGHAQTSSPAKKKQQKKFPVHRQRWWKQNDKLLASVRPVKTGLTTSNSSPPERTVHKKSRHDNFLAKWWKADSPGSQTGSNPINSNFPWECNA